MSGQHVYIPQMPAGGANVHFYSIAATKHAVTALTEGVRRELRAMASKVRVTVSMICWYMSYCIVFIYIYQSLNLICTWFFICISPGLVRTEFVARLMKNSDVKTVQDAMGDVAMYNYSR